MAHSQPYDDDDNGGDPYAHAIVSIGKALEQWTQCPMKNWVTPTQYVDKLGDGILILKALDKIVAAKEAEDEKSSKGDSRPSTRSSSATVSIPDSASNNSKIHQRLATLRCSEFHCNSTVFYKLKTKNIYELMNCIYQLARKWFGEDVMEVQTCVEKCASPAPSTSSNYASRTNTPRSAFDGFKTKLGNVFSPSASSGRGEDLRKVCKNLQMERDDNAAKLKELRKEKDELIKQKKQILANVDTLKNELSETQEARSSLQENIRSLQEQVENLKGFIQEKDQQMEGLRKEQRNALKNKNDEIDRLREQLSSYETELTASSSHEETETLLRGKQEAERRIEELTEQLQIAEESHNEAQQRQKEEMNQMEQYCNKVKASAADTKAKARFTISKCRSAHELLKNSRQAMRQISAEMRESFQSAHRHFSSFRSNLLNCVEKINEESVASNERFLRESRERRWAFNQLQDLKGNIRVFCRVRPLLKQEQEQNEKTVVQCSSDYEVELLPDNASYTDTHNGGGDRASSASRSFKFDRVFSGNSTQQEVYDEISPMVMSALDGYHACIFAYGQTGSGKTYTMEGNRDLPPHQRGVYFRALKQLFDEQVARRDSHRYTLEVSMVEIYNETIRDLLTNNQTDSKLGIKTGRNGNYLPDATKKEVRSVDEVQQTMSTGAGNRAQGATDANEHSSRSHSLLLVDIHGENIVDQSKTYGRLVLVDLAGSERVSKSNASGQRMVEAQNINKSLSALGDVIEALTHKKTHVPYRNSTLTKLLQDSLGKDNKALMVVQVSPVESSRSESQCSLNFASRVRKVEQGSAKRHEENSDQTKLKKCKEDLKKVQEERDSLKDSVNSLKEELQSYKKELKNKSQKLEEESTEEDAKTKKLESLKSRLQEEKREKENLSKQVRTLESKLKQSLTKQRESSREPGTTKTAVQKALDTKTKELQKEKDVEVKKAVEATRKEEAQKHRDEKDALEREKAQLKAELNKLRTQHGAGKPSLENRKPLKKRESETEVDSGTKRTRRTATPVRKQSVSPAKDTVEQPGDEPSECGQHETEEGEEEVALEVGAFANRLSELNDTFEIRHSSKENSCDDAKEAATPQGNILSDFEDEVSPIKQVPDDSNGADCLNEETGQPSRGQSEEHKPMHTGTPLPKSERCKRGATGSPAGDAENATVSLQGPPSSLPKGNLKSQANRLKEGYSQESRRGVKFLTPRSQKYNGGGRTPQYQPQPCPSYKTRHEQGMSPAVKSILKREEHGNDENENPDAEYVSDGDSEEFSNDARNQSSSSQNTRDDASYKGHNTSSALKKPRESKTALFGSMLRESSRNFNVALPKTSAKKPRTSNAGSRAKAKAKTAAGVGAIIRGMSGPTTRASQAKRQAKSSSSQRVQWR
eukprot:gb/GECG01010246.1/.p1 GENE.gb/GECG01010246.1/~~gb/GECG01010246.1/.p1  ORF type:complete len:1387 (+),score=285.54 gb/GECG01010246.1/:1-4161(+)